MAITTKPITYDAFRGILANFVADLKAADDTLAKVGGCLDSRRGGGAAASAHVANRIHERSHQEHGSDRHSAMFGSISIRVPLAFAFALPFVWALGLALGFGFDGG